MTTAINCNNTKLENNESPFTELFSLLRRHENSPEGLPTLAYQSEELKIMNQHINNAMDIVLQGLQDVGHLVGVVAEDKKEVMQELSNIVFFVAGITNLTEALNTLRLDTDYVLRQRGERFLI